MKQMDETRYPREGGGNWAWGVVTPKVVVYNLLPSRARYVAQSLIGPKPVGVVVSDRYVVYDYVDVLQRQICWAHLLRDMVRISQRAGQAGQIGRCLLGVGYLLFRWRAQGRSAAQFEPLCRRLKRALERGSEQTQCSRTANTCANLIKLWPALCTFLHDPAVPPTNNAAEQALRAGTQAQDLRPDALTPRRRVHCTRLQRLRNLPPPGTRDLWNFMHQAVVAFIDKTTPPSLLPDQIPSG